MERIKVMFTALIGMVSSLLGVLFIPVMLLIGTNIIDYVTGLMASPNRGEKLKSYKSIKGIIKKVCMWLLVVVGAIVDQLLKYSAETLGITLPFTFLIACIVAIWLICNELLSILENITDIGIKLPPFLLPIVMYVKDQAELKGKMDTDRKSEGE